MTRPTTRIGTTYPQRFGPTSHPLPHEAHLKKALLHLVDERGTSPLIILDEAQHLSDPFLIDLSGFLNFAFDSRDLLTMWLVGLPPLTRLLRMQQHAPLAMRVVHQLH